MKTEPETLNDVYNNPKNTDNDVLIRVINTFINNNNPEFIYENTIYFSILLSRLQESSKVKRDDIKYVVETIKKIEENDKFSYFVEILKQIYKNNFAENYKYLYLMVYLRSSFELFYDKNIRYKKPEYAVMEASGQTSWNVFLSSLENNDYVYLE